MRFVTGLIKDIEAQKRTHSDMIFSPVLMAKMRMNVGWCVSRIAHGQQQIQYFLLLPLCVSIWHLSFGIPFEKTGKYLELKIKIGRNDCRRFSYRKCIQKYWMEERRKITKIPLKLIKCELKSRADFVNITERIEFSNRTARWWRA